jgi:hypothetical protein
MKTVVTVINCLTACLFLCATPAAFSAGIQLGPGASMNLGGGSIDLGCGDLELAGTLTLDGGSITQSGDVVINGGTLDPGSGSVAFTGDWENSGTFNAGSSQVSNVDGCGKTVSNFIGSSAFANFSAQTNTGKTLVFQTGTTTEFATSLALTGLAASRLVIRSNAPGASANFTLLPGASQTINAVDVQDNDARSGERIGLGTPADLESVNSGNTFKWFLNFGSGIPVPGLTLPGKLTLALLFLLFGSLIFRANARSR